MNKVTIIAPFSLLIILLFVPSIVNAQENLEFSNRVDMGIINIPDLIEASGIVESRKNNHVFWSHNDRNNDNRIFAFNSRGDHLGDYWIVGVENQDWEDIAIGPGPVEGVDYLYIGDVGDNDAVHEFIYIYRIPEPAVVFDQNPVDIILSGVETITLQYPDGKRDSETILLDPLTKDIYVISKREFEDIRVYRAPYPQSTDQTIILEKVATLNLWEIVGGDISQTGFEIILKTYTKMYYWYRTPGQSLWSTFDNDPIVLPYIEEIQGEAVCWAVDSMGYYTQSESHGGLQAHLYFYPRKANGSIIINEIMHNPQVVDDNLGEWFELHNISDNSIDLNGWVIMDNGSDNHTIQQSLSIAPGDYLIAGKNTDQNTNGGVVVDYQYINFNLDNTADEILIISNVGDTIDYVTYDENLHYPNQEGASNALLDPNIDNNFGMNWRESIYTYGDGDFGTPGLTNFGHITETTIYEIQYTEDSSGQSPLLGQLVTTSGIVMVQPFGFFNHNFLIQESDQIWSGMAAKKDFVNAERGDRVKITGKVVEHFGLTKIIEISDFEVLEKGVFGIDPVKVTTGEISSGGINSEAYESVLVEVSGTCDNDNAGWRRWSLDDGTGSTLIYNPYYSNFTPLVGQPYVIMGHQYYRNGDFCVLVINNSDIKLNTTDGIEETPVSFELDYNYPNPFNPSTIINYSLSNESAVTITVYDMLGKEINRLISQKQPSGKHSIRWNGVDNDGNTATAGIYFYQLKAGDYIHTKKMLLMK